MGITFLTTHDDVDIPPHLYLEHPEEMTVVMQYQFQNLTVTDDKFSVTLSFSGRSCFLSIPFSAVTAFADPAVNFVLQLKPAMPEALTTIEDNPATAPALVASKTTPFQPSSTGKDDNDEPPGPDKQDGPKKMGKIIALDTFRKKK
jgi:hypothetical protein